MDQFGIMVGLNKKNAFEGWFSKVDDVNNDFMFSVIWGYSTVENDRHAFIQFTNSITHKTKYIRYPLEDLSFTKDPFILTIGQNKLSKDFMALNINEVDLKVKGEFSFNNLKTLKKYFLKPNIMGLLSYLPNECNHSISSLHHKVKGNVSLDNKTYDIDGIGYMEKDWGTSFPKKYVWTQGSDVLGNSVVFSNATVPILGRYATGFFLVILHNDKEYRFSSIEGSKMLSFEADHNSFKSKIQKGNLTVEIFAKQYNPISLKSPNMGEMKSSIKESLDGNLKIALLKDGKVSFEIENERASIDVHFNK